MKEKLSKINNKWVRLVALIIVSTNTGFMIFDYALIPFSNDQIVAGISVVGMIGIELWNHWKNNSYTQEAKHADSYLVSRKKQKKKK